MQEGRQYFYMREIMYSCLCAMRETRDRIFGSFHIEILLTACLNMFAVSVIIYLYRYQKAHKHVNDQLIGYSYPSALDEWNFDPSQAIQL